MSRQHYSELRRQTHSHSFGKLRRQCGRGATERAARRASGLPPSSLPDFANSIRRPFKAATVCAPLVGREREGGSPASRPAVRLRQSGREGFEFKVVVVVVVHINIIARFAPLLFLSVGRSFRPPSSASVGRVGRVGSVAPVVGNGKRRRRRRRMS